MAESPVKKKRRWSLKKKLLVGAMAFLVLLLGVVLTVEGVGRGRLKAAMREARAIGGPVTFDELQAARKVWPDQENGALILVALQPQLASFGSYTDLFTYTEFTALPSFSEAGPPPLGTMLAPEAMQAAEADLKRLEPVLTAIDRLLQFQGGRFPLALGHDPVTSMMPAHASHLETSAKIKSDQALCRVMGGDTSRLVNDVRIIQRHGLLLAEEPILISMLARNACDGITVHTIERALGLTTLTQAQLEQLDAVVAAMEGQDRLWWGVRGERAFFLAETEAMRDRGKPGTESISLPQGSGLVPGVRGFVMQDQAAGLRLQNRLVAALGDPQKARRVSKEIERDLASVPAYQPLTRFFTSSMAHTLDADQRLEAVLRAARAGLAAERYRLDAGRFPPSLEALVPAYLRQVPSDPFDNKPIRYRLDEKGVVIYSIGDDLKDDGGQVASRVPPKQHATDFGFALLPPELRGRPATQPVSEPSGETPAEKAERLRRFREGPGRATPPAVQ